MNFDSSRDHSMIAEQESESASNISSKKRLSSRKGIVDESEDDIITKTKSKRRTKLRSRASVFKNNSDDEPSVLMILMDFIYVKLIFYCFQLQLTIVLWNHPQKIVILHSQIRKLININQVNMRLQI